jgi:hypothetical protein
VAEAAAAHQRLLVASGQEPAGLVDGIAAVRGRVGEALLPQLPLDGVAGAVPLVGEQPRPAGEAALHQEDLGFLAGFQRAERVILVRLTVRPWARRARRRRDGMHEKALLRRWRGVVMSRPDQERGGRLSRRLPALLRTAGRNVKGDLHRCSSCLCRRGVVAKRDYAPSPGAWPASNLRGGCHGTTRGRRQYRCRRLALADSHPRTVTCSRLVLADSHPRTVTRRRPRQIGRAGPFPRSAPGVLPPPSAISAT